MDICIGTTNPGKQREILALFLDTPHHLHFPNEYPELESLSVVETGTTFAENASLKAQAYAQRTGLLTAADDSGLSVEALQGFPGVYSNRWHTGSSEERVQALLTKMAGNKDRQAVFTTVVCAFNPTTQEKQFYTGTLDGSLSTEMRGDPAQGFEYDFVFIPEGEQQTLAELGRAWKVAHSHRTRAFMQFKMSLSAT